MIKVNIFYPKTADSTFDMDYYKTKHMPMAAELTAPACKGWSADSGLGGAAPGEPPAYAAIGTLLYDSVEEFGAAIGPHMDQILADIPNYTNVQPVIQISEVVVG